MTLRVSFDLSDKDLRHFRRVFANARKSAASKHHDEDTIIAAAQAVLGKVRTTTTSDFVEERLDKLAIMIDMLLDAQWQIPNKEKARVINALSYFAEEDDLVPDHIPVLGFLDDAIIIELVVRELRHEIDAFEDFRRYRDERQQRQQTARPDVDPAVQLAQRRKALHERMRRRNSHSRRLRNAGKGPRVRLF